MPRRLCALALLLLMLAQPAAVLAGASGAGAEKEGVSPGTVQEDRHEEVQAAIDVSGSEIGSFSMFMPQGPKDAMRSSSFYEMSKFCIDRPFMAPELMGDALSIDGVSLAIAHRGELDLDEICPSLSSPMLSYGPNTPPPQNSDWIIDMAGNNVNNTTVILNGWLNVTAGDLTLDNVTLVMNCTTDGQFGINVSAGGTLNMTNSIVTAFNGALHYKFAVHGCMTMDRCNVSEMWGNWDIYREGGGIAIFSSGTEIRGSTISKSETTGIQVHGYASPRILTTNISNNGRNGVFILDNASPSFSKSTAWGNYGNGISVYDSSSPTFEDCMVSLSNWTGISVAVSSSPTFEDCMVSLNMAGIALWNTTAPVFMNCTVLGSNITNIQALGNSSGLFMNCTVLGSNITNILALGNSSALFMNCTSLDSNLVGISVSENAHPSFIDCLSSGSGWVDIISANTSSPNFTNCTSRGSGIHTWGSSRAHFTSCTSFGSTNYGVSMDDNPAPVFVGCDFAASSLDGIAVYGNSTPQFINCTSRDNNRTGIYVVNTSAPVFTNCSIINNSQHGMGVAEYACPMATDCTFTKNELCGIIVTMDTTSTFTNCTSADNSANGIEFHDRAHSTVEDCTFRDNKWVGIIVFNTAHPIISDCVSLGNTVAGIRAHDQAFPTVRNCTSSDNGGFGLVSWDDSAPEFCNCTSSNNSINGMTVQNRSRPLISNCVFANNTLHGIQVSDQASPRISNCTSSENTWYGIQVSDQASPKISDCTFSKNRVCGILVLNESIPIVSNCTSENNTWNGIDIQDNSSATIENCRSNNNSWQGFIISGNSVPVIMNCTSTNNGFPGIATRDQARPTILNTTSKNNNMGIYIMGNSVPVIINCTSMNNIGPGIITMDQARPTITNCSSANNQEDGIRVSDSSAPVVLGSSFKNNLRCGLYLEDSCSPSLEKLILGGNGAQNVLAASTAPVVLANSTLAGESLWEMMLVNSSRLTILNTTYKQKSFVSGSAQLKVQWYATFQILDRARNTIPDAAVEGTGKNGSRTATGLSGTDGMIREMIVTEYVQNATDNAPEFRYFSPYDFSVDVDGETNITRDIAICGTISTRLHFDYSPRITYLDDIRVIEDRPTFVDLNGHLVDPDNSLDMLGFTVDRSYVSVDNESRRLLINCPAALGSDIINITVSDGLKTGAQTLTIYVTAVNDPPRCIVPIPDQVVYEDVTMVLDLTSHFLDEESGSRLAFTCNMEELTIDHNGKASWTPGEGNSSLEGVVITASDGYLQADSNPFNINFTAVNEPPVYTGGLEDATVQEHKNWTRDLDDCFQDEEDSPGMIIDSNSPEITVNRKTHVAEWKPSGISGYSIQVTFTAHDAQNYSLTAESDPFTLTYVPVNDPPVYLGTLVGARLKSGDEWNITLETHFKDEDTAALSFAVNNPNIKIIKLNNTTHCAVWKPNRFSTGLEGVVFTAYDGQTYVRSSPITLAFDAPADDTEQSPIIRIVQSIPVGIYILLPVGVIGGIAAFYAYRRVRYGKYRIEQIFLVFQDGRLLAHRSREPLIGGSEEIISGMLTAIQGFIKEFLVVKKPGGLDEMKYGDLKLAIERKERIFIAVFLTGYVTDKMRADMRKVLDKAIVGYGVTLDSWDGTLKKLEGLAALVEELMGEPKPAGRR